MYAPELFPTQARTRGFAFVNTVGNIGFMCAPLITTNLVSQPRVSALIRCFQMLWSGASFNTGDGDQVVVWYSARLVT